MDKDKYYDSGEQKLKSEDYEGAIADLSKAIEFNPTDERALVSRADSKFYLAVDADDDDLLIDALIDYKKALELGSYAAEIKLDGIEESLRENAKSDSKEAKDCAKILKEHFDIDTSKDKSEEKKIIITKEQRKSASDLCLTYANESSNHMDNLAIIALALGVDIGITDEVIFEIVNGDKSIKGTLIGFITILWNQEDSNDEMFKPFIELKAELNNDIKPLLENIDWLTIERLWNGCLTKFGIELKD